MKKLLAVLALATFALTACANKPATPSGGSADATQTVLDAFAKTTQSGSARMALDLTVTSPQKDLHVTGQAEYEMDAGDLTSVREHVTLQIPSLAPGMPAGEIELIVAKGPILYAKAPMLTPFLGATTPWIKVDPAALGGGNAAVGTAAGMADPAAALALIQDAIDVQLVGPDPVGGVDATKYTATLDLVKVLPKLTQLAPDTASKLTPQDLAKMQAELERVGMDHLPLDVWVDGDGYLKQIQLALDTTTMSDDPSSAMKFALTVTFSDVGAHFAIEAPPESQVTDISDLAPMGGMTTTTTTHTH